MRVTPRRPIWSCSGWSLPCYALLPGTRCALTAPFHPYQSKLAVFSLLHLSSVLPAQALPGTLPYGARTFLPLKTSMRQRLSGQLPQVLYSVTLLGAMLYSSFTSIAFVISPALIMVKSSNWIYFFTTACTQRCRSVNIFCKSISK